MEGEGYLLADLLLGSVAALGALALDRQKLPYLIIPADGEKLHSMEGCFATTPLSRLRPSNEGDYFTQQTLAGLF